MRAGVTMMLPQECQLLTAGDILRLQDKTLSAGEDVDCLTC